MVARKALDIVQSITYTRVYRATKCSYTHTGGAGSGSDVELINRLYQGYRVRALDTADGGVIQTMRVS